MVTDSVAEEAYTSLVMVQEVREDAARSLSLYFAVSAFGYLVVIALMTIMGVSATGRWNFVFATMVPLIALLLTAGVGLFVPTRGSVTPLRVIGSLCIAAYVPLSAFAYASQYALLPTLQEAGSLSAELWDFTNPQSVPFIADLLAYAIYGIGATLIAPGLIGRRGVWRWGGWSLLLSGITCVAAFVLLAAGRGPAELLSLASGVLTVPFAIAAIIYARQLRHAGDRFVENQ